MRILVRGRLLRDAKSLWWGVDVDEVEGKALGGFDDGGDVELALALGCAGVERDDLRRSG